MNVAVIGGGWAGLSAAYRLATNGVAVTVFEAGRQLGGRARRAHSPALGIDLDNGQHILLGAYTETLALMAELGVDLDAALYRERLDLRALDGGFRLRAPGLPAPLHLAIALLRASGLSLRDRAAIAILVQRLRRSRWRVPHHATVSQWLHTGRQSPRAQAGFWRPLCLAAMNTPPHGACAQLFANVLRDSLGGSAEFSDVLIPRTDLSTLWPDRLRSLHVPGSGRLRLETGHAVRRLESTASGLKVDGMAFDAAVVACNAPAGARLLRGLEAGEGTADFLAAMEAFTFIPIATVSLVLERPWGLPQPMWMLREDATRRHYGQWLFDASALAGSSSAASNRLSVVISDARAIGHESTEVVVAGVVEQLREQARGMPALPPVTAGTVITDKRATFAAIPGLRRPAVRTPWRGVWVAGDWTDTGYPGVLEGAVRSGRQAAQDLSTAGRTG